MIGVMPQKCPACGEDMHVCLLRCPVCATEVQGDFIPGRFSRLSAEQLSFLETFIRCRGNLKDVGMIIGISYPTARNRLDAMIQALGFEEKSALTERRLEILTQVKEGKLTAEQALGLLQGGKSDE